VLEIRQPLVLRIPRSDPDLADMVMVLLNQGKDSSGNTYLDQATTGTIFKLSWQTAKVRVAPYKRRQHIVDVLSRE
jgi:predicted Zn-dependent protease